MYIKNSRTSKISSNLSDNDVLSASGRTGQCIFRRKEVTPKIPPKGERMRILIASHATNEIDDVLAIALAILSPERFDIEGEFMLKKMQSFCY